MTITRLDEPKQVNNLISRIESAREGSKIALFKSVEDGVAVVDARFDATVLTTRRIKQGDTDYIGSFYGAEAKKAIDKAREFLRV